MGWPPRRAVDAHKGDFGHVCIVAGSLGFHGAAVLAARAALRARPGLVTVITAPECYVPVAAQLDAAMVMPWSARMALPAKTTAVVVGPPGEEIHVDAYGRVKVRFHWDRRGVDDDRSSCWLRVGQLALGGPMLIPRVGFEVLVDHELGDLDRPVVVGHLYNGEQPPPYELPAQSVVSSLQTATTQLFPGSP
jgi:uncharacterized protein involved in type VI secretion and phage assembly